MHVDNVHTFESCQLEPYLSAGPPDMAREGRLEGLAGSQSERLETQPGHGVRGVRSSGLLWAMQQPSDAICPQRQRHDVLLDSATDAQQCTIKADDT